jgi:hypothetical protein
MKIFKQNERIYDLMHLMFKEFNERIKDNDTSNENRKDCGLCLYPMYKSSQERKVTDIEPT